MSVQTVKKQQKRSLVMRNRLLDSTVDCLLERGYAGTTVQAISEISGVSRGAQQHHFPTRELLIIAAVEHLTELVIESIREGAECLDPRDDAVTGVLKLLWEKLSGKWFSAGYELWIAARTDPALLEVFRPAEARAAREILRVVTDLLPDEMTNREQFPYDLQAAVRLLHGLALTRIVRPDKESEEHTLDICRHILAGYK